MKYGGARAHARAHAHAQFQELIELPQPEPRTSACSAPMPFLRAAAAGATLQLAATMLQLHGSQAFGGGAKPTFSSIKCRPDSRDAGVTCMHPDMSGVGSASIGCCDSSNRNSQSAAASFGPGHFNANRSLYTCKYGSSANGYRPCEMVPPSCVDIPGFKDAYGTCATYAAHSW